jgi:hypothetical protein
MMLKNCILAAIGGLMIGAALAHGADVPASGPATQPAPIPLLKVETPLVIDGDLNKPEWKKVEPIRVDYIQSKKGILSDTPRETVRYLWDEHYLYIGYEFYTKNLKAQGTGKKKGPEGNEREGAEIFVPNKNVDIAEFFITFDDPNFFWEVHLNELNQFNDLRITVADPSWKLSKQANVPYGIVFGSHDYIEDEGPYKLVTAVKMLPKADGKPSTVNDPSDVDTGYSAEIRLPWYGLGAPKARRTTLQIPAKIKGDRATTAPGPWKMAGEQINILAVYQDLDLPERYHHSSATKPPGGWFHQSEPYWQVFKLVDGK